MSVIDSVKSWFKKTKKAQPDVKATKKRQLKDALGGSNKGSIGGNRGTPRTQQYQLKELDRLEKEEAARKKK